MIFDTRSEQAMEAIRLLMVGISYGTAVLPMKSSTAIQNLEVLFSLIFKTSSTRNTKSKELFLYQGDGIDLAFLALGVD